MTRRMVSIGRNKWWVLLLSVCACGEDPAPVAPIEEVTLSFDFQSKLQVKENQNEEITIPIKLSLSQEEPITIVYEAIGQEVVNGSDFTILTPNPLTIPTGGTQTSITFRINDNNVVQPEERNIYFRIRTISKANIKTVVPKEVVVSILEDDCLAKISDVKVWFGSLTLLNQNEVSQGTGLENAQGVCSGSLDVKGKFVGSQNPESTVTIKLTQDAKVLTKGTAIVDRAKLFASSSQFEIQATGNYDELTKKITLNYSFFDLSNTANNFNSTLVIEAGI